MLTVSPIEVIEPLLKEYSGHDLKPSDGETPVLEILAVWSTPSFPLIPGPL